LTTSSTLPIEYYWEADQYCEVELRVAMEFRLIYYGPLLSSANNNRVKHKHIIRKLFHKQLAEVWKVKYPMKHLALSWTHIHDAATGESKKYNAVDELCDRHTKGGFRFAPMITRENGLVCALEVLFLRHNEEGLITQSGDMDNRVSTLFDALAIPRDQEVDKKGPEESENPFYCLLEDDSLITELRVTTDRLWTREPVDPRKIPLEEGETAPPNEGEKPLHPEYNVLLVIGVRTMVADQGKAGKTRWLYA
jgi:hypothetical protein